MRRMPKKPKVKKPARAAKPRAVNKSAFVRGLPAALSAADVVTAAKKEGFKLSTAQVYTIRANARRAGTKSGAKSGAKAGSKGESKAVKSATPTAATSPSAPATKNRSAFIRSMPGNMPAGEVVAKAKAAGLTLTAGLVYAVRSSAKNKGTGGVAALAGKISSPATGNGALEKQFVSLALDLGLSNAEALLARVRARLRDL
jgi:hypothetical protein